MQDPLAVSQRELSIQPETYDAPRLNVQEAGARILEFPRSAAPPPVFPPAVFDELAEPVVDRPRILEVPELELPPPALGGILMDPVAEPEKERRPASRRKGLRRHHGDADLHFLLASVGHCPFRPGLLRLLRRRRRGKGHRQERALVHPGGDALQLLRARALHRVQRDVRARRRVSRGEGSHGGWRNSRSPRCCSTTC